MTKIKLCGLSRPCDIEAANRLKPEYIGFVFAKKSRRYLTPQEAEKLKRMLEPGIRAVGVFVNEDPETVAELLDCGTIDVAQLHGNETEDYIGRLRTLTDKPIIKVCTIETQRDVLQINVSSADFVLLDSGSGGTGTVFDWELIRQVKRPCFLAGGLNIGNIKEAIRILNPYGVDVSSGIETDGRKDNNKMAAFVHAVRKEDGK